MYEYAKYDVIKLSSIIYFLSIILIGNILLYNLFLAILINNFEVNKNNFEENGTNSKKILDSIKIAINLTSLGYKSIKQNLDSFMKKYFFESESEYWDKINQNILKNKSNRRKA